ncbi:MAG: type III ribulose-bisphosphate carboxylase [Methanocellales archaeon]|nr:type III ribulose-bisphosphate carboxylase [Methanocellales archaeon]
MREEYIDLGYEPAKNDLVCEYYVEPARGIDFERTCVNIAGESSIDTWTDILTLSPKLAKKLKPHAFDVNQKTKTVKIAYHMDLFEINSIPQLLSSIAGNIFSMKLLTNLRLQDVSFPKKVIKNFKGPKFGIPGVRKLLNVKNRPLCGTIVKPKVGLSSEKHAQVAYKAWLGGIDLVKDDENLTNQTFNPFEKRVIKTLKLRDKAEKETGDRKVYAANITAPTCDEMLRRAQFIKEQGGEYAMIDIIPTGFTALQTLREENETLDLVLHAHRCMHSAMTRNPRHGISMQIIAKLVRLIGLDQLHIGTVIGKMHGEKEEVLAIRDSCVLNHVKENRRLNVLEQDWGSIKPLFPVASGGLQPTMVPKLIEIFGMDIIMQFGGGVHGHPWGTRAGAMAVRQALDAALGDIPLEDYSRTHKELKVAMEKWG